MSIKIVDKPGFGVADIPRLGFKNRALTLQRVVSHFKQYIFQAWLSQVIGIILTIIDNRFDCAKQIALPHPVNLVRDNLTDITDSDVDGLVQVAGCLTFL